jgi:hypothetical protein
MEKTIQNIKKILHIGPKKSKGELSENGSSEKTKVQQKVLTAKVELTREDIPGAKPRDYETVVFTG